MRGLHWRWEQVAGLSAPIPPGAQFGFQPGAWGKPPVDENGEPLYGDVFGQNAGADDDELVSAALHSSARAGWAANALVPPIQGRIVSYGTPATSLNCSIVKTTVSQRETTRRADQGAQVVCVA